MTPRVADLGDMPALTAGFRPFIVPEKPCGCGALEGDQCDCAEVAAEWDAAMARPIYWRQSGGYWTAGAA